MTIPLDRRNKDVTADEGAFQMYPYTICDGVALRLLDAARVAPKALVD